MSKINETNNGFYRFYLIGFFIILALPLLVLPPWFSPTDWGKTIVFRSILSILLFLFVFQFLYKKHELKLPTIKKNKIIWLLLALFTTFLLATIFSADTLFSLWGSPYRAGGFITFAFYFLFAILAFFVLKNRDWNKIWAFSFSTGILVSFIAIIQYYGLFNKIFISDADRPPSTLGNPILLGIYLLLLIFLALSFAIKETKLAKKIFYYFSASLFLYVILITGSRAAYLGFLVGITYFILFYPIKKLLRPKNKITILKIVLVALLVIAGLTVYYVNSRTEYPQILQENRIFQAMRPRLSIEMFLDDPRFSAWQVAVQAIKEKPMLGWGPENFAIGFDKYYDPSLPYISKAWGGWWDKGHNIMLDIGVQAGMFAVIAYLALFIVLFWQLHKSKNLDKSEKISINQRPIIIHGIQATLIGYFTANFFSFDSFASYLIFFLLIGYSLYLISLNTAENQPLSANVLIRHCERMRSNLFKLFNRLLRLTPRNDERKIKYKKATIVILFILLILFLWKYNILPFQINTQINKADHLIDNKKCDQALLIMENNVLKKRGFLEVYAAIHYIEGIKKCAETNPGKNLEYVKNGTELIKKTIKIRPLYSRLWLFLGSFTTIEAIMEENLEIKENLIKEAYSYFEKAEELAPKHQEILIESAKTDMIAGNYQSMKEKSEKCILLDPTIGDCYWVRALSKIYLKDFDNAQLDIQKATNGIFITNSASSLSQLANAYAAVENYKELALTYEKLIVLKPNVPPYHSSLAFTYAKMGEYKKARQEAMLFLQLMPEAKEEVNLFLKMLPY